MKANGLRIFYSVISLQCLMFPLASAHQAGSGFSSSFSRAIGYVLRGFLLGEMEVSSVIECKRRCVISANCLSLNILTNSDGSIVCQLNSQLKENGVKEQFVQHGSGEYYGLKEKNIVGNDETSLGKDPTWHAFNQSYFKFVTSELSWEEARKVCLEMKGELASTSSEEQTFLFKTFLEENSIAGDYVWVGLNDIAEESVFVWSDGSPNTYVRFWDGQPNNLSNNEHCVVMGKNENGDHGDATCSYLFMFICETNYENHYE